MIEPTLITQGSIPRTLIKLSIPMLFGILSMMAFNLIDTFFISKLGTTALAALTLTFPVIMVITTFTIGLSVGAMAVISRTIGEGKTDRIKRYTTDSLSLAGFCVIILSIIGYATIDQIFIFLGADSEMLPLVRSYMSTWYWGMLFFVVPLIGNNVIRATGDTLTPSILMIIGIVINIVLDPLLIFGWGPLPAYHIQGAALASNISRGISLIFTLWYLHTRKKLLTHPWPGLHPLFHSWKSILSIGFPVALSNAVIPLSIGILTKIIAHLGPSVIAGFGVGTRVEAIGFTVIIALSTAMSPFVGQNFGANQILRIEQGLTFSRNFSLIFGIILFILSSVFGKMISQAFTHEPPAVESAVLYLLIVSTSLGFRGIHQIIWTSLNVLSRPYDALILELILAFGLWIPAAYIGNACAGMIGVYIGLSCSNCIGGFIALLWMRSVLKHLSMLSGSELKK